MAVNLAAETDVDLLLSELADLRARVEALEQRAFTLRSEALDPVKYLEQAWGELEHQLDDYAEVRPG